MSCCCWEIKMRSGGERRILFGDRFRLFGLVVEVVVFGFGGVFIHQNVG